ncbi:hypothetical protein ACVSQB_06695 [Bradyrhizobium elkanii]
MHNAPIAAPAQAKNPAARIWNSSVNQTTITVGIAVSRQVMMKTAADGSNITTMP